MKRQIFYSFFILLILSVVSIHATDKPSLSDDSISEFFEKLAKTGTEFAEKEVALEKRRRHHRAVRILRKIKRKFGNDFECSIFSFDPHKKECLARSAQKKRMTHAHYFEQIKRHRSKLEDIEVDLDTTKPLNELNAQDINKQMHALQAEYIRLFRNEIHKERASRKKNDTTQKHELV